MLIVEDELSFQQNYKQLLSELDLQVEAVSTAPDALLALYKKHFNVVLLDLSLDPDNQFDRSSQDVQLHLTHQTDGTQYIIVSRHAEKEDVRDSFKLSAFYVIFKTELSARPALLNEQVQLALDKSNKIDKDTDLIGRSYSLLHEGMSTNKWEYEMMSILKSRGGFLVAKNFIVEQLLELLAPIVNHKTKTHLAAFPHKDCILGLLWSRQLGEPVSVYMSNTAVDRSDEDVRMLLNDWLGWMPGIKITDLNKNGVRAKIFSENENIGFNEFMLLQP